MTAIDTGPITVSRPNVQVSRPRVDSAESLPVRVDFTDRTNPRIVPGQPLRVLVVVSSVLLLVVVVLMIVGVGILFG